jgi:Fe-S oxidoreductase
MDRSLLKLARNSDGRLKNSIPADVDSVLLIEFDGPSAEDCAAAAAGVRDRLMAGGLAREAQLAIDANEKQRFWAVRKAAVPLLYKLKGRKKILALVEDAAVPVDRLVDFFKGLYAIFRAHRVDFVIYGHIAKGLLHSRPLLDLKDPADRRLLRILADAVFDLVRSLDGTISGEHGDGRLRSAYVRRQYPRIYDLFVQTKALLDPQQLFNPDLKVTDDPDQMCTDLRFGKSYRASDLDGLQLIWNEGFNAAVELCHGCSKCTTTTNATRMCPVYKFTRDESAAPKAKANVLRALISGAVEASALHAQVCRRVMELCVNCGSCAKECPSNVNIPKLAMEAKAQFVTRSGASVTDRVTGHVGDAARLLHRLAPVMNTAMQLPAIRTVSQRLTGLSAERNLALFDKRSLYASVAPMIPGRTKRHVLYFAGCFAGYMRPAVGEAAVSLLHQMGFTVHVPPQGCCGLPMLTKGMVAGARRQVQRNLSDWRRLIDRVDAVTVTCSSCGFALMADWRYLTGDARARRIGRKTVHISRLILDCRDRLSLESVPKKLAYHQPCHLRLQTESRSSIELLRTIPGVSLYDLKSHCCGMAGSWGMAAENQRLSRRIGSQMVNRINGSAADWAVTDCPTCEMQMVQFAALPVRHPVEVLWHGVKRNHRRRP